MSKELKDKKYGLWSNIPKWISYSIAPLMVVWLNWTSVSIEKLIGTELQLEATLAITVICFVLFYIAITNFNIRKKPKENYIKSFLSKMIQMKTFSKAILYFVLIITSGFLVDTLSKFIILNYDNQISKHYINLVISISALILLVVHKTIGDKRSEQSYALILLAILASSAIFFFMYTFTGYYEEYKLGSFIALTIYTVFLFHKVANSFAKPVNSLDTESEFNPKEHLILFLSVLRGEKDLLYWGELKEGLFKSKPLIEIAKDIMKKYGNDKHHQWEMNLRAIAYHIQPNKKLKQITLLASNEQLKIFPKKIIPGQKEIKQSSMEQLNEFIEFINKYLNMTFKTNEVKIRVLVKNGKQNFNILQSTDVIKNKRQSKEGVDFNDFEEIKEALSFIINHTDNKEFKHPDTVIDFTGGQKPTSAAATLMATSYPIRNQYVNTNGEKNVEGYNFVYVNPANIS